MQGEHRIQLPKSGPGESTSRSALDAVQSRVSVHNSYVSEKKGSGRNTEVNTIHAQYATYEG